MQYDVIPVWIAVKFTCPYAESKCNSGVKLAGGNFSWKQAQSTYLTKRRMWQVVVAFVGPILKKVRSIVVLINICAFVINIFWVIFCFVSVQSKHRNSLFW